MIALPRSTFYYRQQRSDVKQQEDQKIIERLERLAREFARYGVRRMTAQLRHEGFWRSVPHFLDSQLCRDRSSFDPA